MRTAAEKKLIVERSIPAMKIRLWTEFGTAVLLPGRRL
jgi:hypothetical protein